MLRTGAIILTIWTGVSLLLAVAILLAITLFRQNAPALSFLFDAVAIQQLDAKVLATINALAVLCNACIAAFCTLSLFVIRGHLMSKSRWAFWALLISFGLLQVCGFISDAFVEGKALLANYVSTVVLVLRLGLSGYAVQR